MTQFKFPGQQAFYKGKVRDVYTLDNDLLVMIASDRISAFDVILPRPIPFKGQVLNQIAAFMLNATTDICPMRRLGSKHARVITNKRNGLLVTVQLAVDARINPADVGVLVKDYLGIKAIRVGSSFI